MLNRVCNAVPFDNTFCMYVQTHRNNARYGQPSVISFTVSQDIEFLEHVVLTATLGIGDKGRSYTVNDYYNALEDEDILRFLVENPHPRRGDIQMELTSPQGTTSTILPYRAYDFVNTEDNFHGNAFYLWPFTSVHYWGEDPNGEWNLTVTFKSSSGFVSVRDLELTVYGTNSTPQAVLNTSAQCDEACARGCYGPSSRECDTCKDFRVVSTLECVTVCPNTTFYYKDSYCTDYLITIPHQVNIALIVGLSVGLSSAFACVVCIAFACGLRLACRRKKIERQRRHRYRILHSEDDNTSVPV